MRKRNIHLTLMRVLCCLGVIGLHAVYRERWLNGVYYLCCFSIPCFFMSSGYVLMNRGPVPCSYLKKIQGFLKTIFVWEFLYWAVSAVLEPSVFLESPAGYLCAFLQDCVQSPLQLGKLGHFWYFTGLSILYCMVPALSRIKQKGRCALVAVLLSGG